MQCITTKDESFEDWANRVMTFAIHAIKEWPENYSVQLAILRSCHGLIDKG